MRVHMKICQVHDSGINSLPVAGTAHTVVAQSCDLSHADRCGVKLDAALCHDSSTGNLPEKDRIPPMLRIQP